MILVKDYAEGKYTIRRNGEKCVVNNMYLILFLTYFQEHFFLKRVFECQQDD